MQLRETTTKASKEIGDLMSSLQSKQHELTEHEQADLTQHVQLVDSVEVLTEKIDSQSKRFKRTEEDLSLVCYIAWQLLHKTFHLLG